MTYSNRGYDSFGGGNYGRRDSNDRNSGPREMFDATCAQCGSACKVPFKPNGRKEVFCSKCFETNGGGTSRESSFGGGSRESYSAPRGPRMFDKRDSGSSFGGDRPMFSATCDQCGERCEVPFRPTNGKPVLCSNCFAQGKSDNRSNFSAPSFAPKGNSVDLEAINAKLDKIIRLLSTNEPKAVVIEAANEEAKVVAKEITAKILEEIEMTSGKKIETGKKKVKAVSKKKAE